MKSVTIREVEYLAHSLAKELMSWDEPIPEFSSRYPHVLESCLATPLQMFGGKSLYKGMIEKAAMLFYLMIKNHPFKNGNKRIAVTTLFLFLYKNHKWVKIDNVKLYAFARWVAESTPEVKDATVSAIKKMLTVYIIPFSPTTT